MFVRGGVYVVVRDAMGHFMARLSVSALIFDYILTGPISVVSAGQYLGHLLNEIRRDACTSGTRVSPNLFAAGFGVLVTVYFWWSNIKGIHESSGKALRIMQITTVMVVAFLIWCPITLLLQRERALAARADARESAVQRRRAGLVQRHRLAADRRRSRSSSRSATRCSP